MPNSFTEVEVPADHPETDKMPAVDRLFYKATETIEAPISGLI